MPTTSDMLMRRAARHHLAGQLREAASIYRKLLQDDPQHAGALHALGVLAHQTGRDDAAEKLLQRAVAINPKLAAAYDDLGSLWLLQGKLEQAMDAFRHAAQMDPSHGPAHAHIGAVLMKLGQPEAAAAAYQRSADAALTQARRRRAVGIDVRAFTSTLAPVADVLPLLPAVADETPKVPAAVDALAVVKLNLPGEVAEAGSFAYAEGYTDRQSDDADDDEDDGLVGLTLVPPSAMELASATMGQSWQPEPALAVPVWADAFQPALAWARVEALVDAAWLRPADEPAGLPAFRMADGPDLRVGAIAIEDRDPAHALPQIEAEIGNPRFDAPHALSSGMVRAGERFGSLADNPPADRSNGHAHHQPSPPAYSGSLLNDHDEYSEQLTLVDVPDDDDTAYTLAEAPDAGSSTHFTLAADSAGTAMGDTTSAGVDEDLLESEQSTYDPVSLDPAELAELAQLRVEEIEEIDEPADVTPEDLSPIEIVPLLQPDAEQLPEQAEARTSMPTSPPRVVLPASAAKLAEDPLLATRKLAKELRRARRSAAAGGRQAAQLQKQGSRHLRQRRVDEAIAALQGLVELHPKSAKAHRDLGAAYIRADRLDEAMASLNRALELRPRFSDALASLGDVFHLQGRVEEAIACYRQTLALRPSAAAAHSNLLLTLNYQRKIEPDTLFAEHVKWGRIHAEPFARNILPHDNDPTINRQIRIGYVSGDFRRHAVGSFVEPIIAKRNANAFHVICYSDVLRPDDTTERLSAMSDGWRDLRGLSDTDVAEMVRHDKIDILVDLAGHTGGNRLGVFARKPAPVQVTYLGYPNTTGVPTIDYRVSDAWADPLGQTEAYHTEQLYRLPRGFLCYQPPADAPLPAPPPIATNGYVTLGCFNILAKLTPETLALWAKIMTVLPKSRLVLKDRLGTLACPARRRHVQDIFAYHRISADRLELLGKEPDRIKHLESYAKVDLMLDPFPYNGTTTTCEALWMGVPVITLAGTRHASRVGVSILKSAGLPELIAINIESYARTTVLLGRDVNRLTMLRKTLRQKIATSPLTDAAKFTSALEVAYREMWAYWCQQRGQPMLPAANQMLLEG